MKSLFSRLALQMPAKWWRAQIWYVPLLATAMLLMMFRPLIMARIFDAPEFAKYSAGLLISSTFCMLGCFGLQSLLQRQMPMDITLGRERSGLLLLVQAIVVGLMCALVLMGLQGGVSEFSLGGLTGAGVVVGIVHGLSQQLFVLATVESRSRGEPLRFSYQNLARASLVVIGAALSAWFFRSPTTALLTEALLSFFVTWLIFRGLLKKVRLSGILLLRLAGRNLTKVPWRSALALLGVMVVGFSLVNADRWLAASLLHPNVFANYALAWVLLTAAQSVQTIINSSVYPALAKRYAKKGRSDSFDLAVKVSLSLLGSGLFVGWPAILILNWGISRWFPDYLAARALVPVFVAIGVLRLSDFWSSHLIIVGQERLLLIVNVLVGIVILSVWLLMVYVLEVVALNMLSLSLLALSLTIANYSAVLFTAFQFRRSL